MIVAVGADKGSPGVTTVASVLAMVWPGQRVLLEADPAGGDLAFRLRPPLGAGRLLDPEPSVLSLAADVRGGLPPGGLARYGQPTSLGFDVIPGALSAEGFAPVARLWPQVAAAAHRWPATVVADVGRLQPGTAVLPVVRAATVVLLLARPSLEGLYHLRDRVGELAAAVADPAAGRSRVAVVVTARSKDRRDALGQVRQLLGAAGSPVPVAGFVPYDRAAVELLRAGVPGRRLAGSDLLRSVRALAETVVSWWPQLAGSPAPPAGPGTAAGDTSGAAGAGVAGGMAERVGT